MSTHAITDVAVILKPEDDVAIAKREIAAGSVLEDADGRLEVRQDIRPGHKVARRARRARRAGDSVRRYGQVIGFATRDIAAGDHVHSHNLGGRPGGLGQADQERAVRRRRGGVRPLDHRPRAVRDHESRRPWR